MRLYVITLLSLILTCLGCSDSDESLQGWKESDVEVVNEGAATGTTGEVVVSGDAAPMTATSLDTTTDLDMITDEQLGLADGTSDDTREGEPRQRSLADQFDSPPTEAQRDPRDPAPRRSTAEQRPARTTTQTPAPRPSTARQSRPQPSETEDETAERAEPRPADRSEPEQEEDLPPVVVVPPREPEPPSDESQDTPPPSNDTSPSGRSQDSPEDDESDEESE